MKQNTDPTRPRETRKQATIPATEIQKLILRYRRKRAGYHKRMLKAHKQKDEMTQIVSGALALAYTDAQANLEKLLN